MITVVTAGDCFGNSPDYTTTGIGIISAGGNALITGKYIHKQIETTVAKFEFPPRSHDYRPTLLITLILKSGDRIKNERLGLGGGTGEHKLAVGITRITQAEQLISNLAHIIAKGLVVTLGMGTVVNINQQGSGVIEQPMHLLYCSLFDLQLIF